MKKSDSGGKSGKGDKPRNCSTASILNLVELWKEEESRVKLLNKENFDKIEWKKMKFERPPIEKVYFYPEYLNELVCALMEEQVSPEDYIVSDESMVSDFWILGGELPKTVLKLQEKYGLKELKMSDYIWEVVEKMYQNRPLR